MLVPDMPDYRPMFIGFHFVRSSARRYDFHNAVQILFDLMVAHRILEDDDTTQVYGVPLELNGAYQTIDKEKQGVYIHIFNTNLKLGTNG